MTKGHVPERRRKEQHAPASRASAGSSSASAAPSGLHELQRLAGNAAVVGLLSSPETPSGLIDAGTRAGRVLVQASLEVGRANDPAEIQADQAADAVVEGLEEGAAVDGMLESLGRVRRTSAPSVPGARSGDGAAVGHEGGPVPQAAAARIERARGGGRRLDEAVQRSMESAFGADFSSVRVHDDAGADALNRQLGATAFTTGSDVFFRSGAYRAETTAGQRLIAHELTHVVQQQGGGSLRRTVVRRAEDDIVKNWTTESRVKGKPRSKALKRLDAAIQQWVTNASYGLPAVFSVNLACIENIEQQIDAWKATKDDPDASVRAAKMGELEAFLAEQKHAFLEKKRQREEKEELGRERHGVFHSMEPGLAAFAGRSTVDYKPERFHEVTPGSYSDLLTRDRGTNGELSDDVLEHMVALDEVEGDKEVEKSKNAGFDLPENATVEDIEKLLADPRYLNPVTGKTTFPELENLLDEMRNTTKPVPDEVEVFDVGGTKITATFNPGDVNYDARWAQVKAAVEKVQQAGWDVPDFTLHLPKLGRKVTVTKTATDCTVQEGAASNRAVFWAPNFMHVSSANINNPLDTKSTMNEGKFKFSSTELDPSGIGTIVHELGHMLHFHNDPKKFQGLWGAIFKGKGTNKDGEESPLQDIAIKEVSEYGNKPREMVAEVFLGLVYGKTYSDQVMDVYHGLGGAPRNA